MSTIATTNIKEPSSATNNITLTSGGATTIGGLTYPTADGTTSQVLTTDGSGTLSFASPFTYGTAHTFDNTTSEKTFTGIPSTAKRITVLIEDLSATSNGSNQIFMRVGPSSGVITTNIYKYGMAYASFPENSTANNYYRLTHSNYTDQANIWSGKITITRLTASGNKWIVESQLGGTSGPIVNISGGSIDLGTDDLERLQIYHGGTINYDSGIVNIMYES